MSEKEVLKIYKKSKENVLERANNNLEKSIVSESNKNLIYKFQDFLFAKGSKNQRVSKLTTQLRKVCEYLVKKNLETELDKLEKSDVMSLISYINRLEGLSEATKSDYRRAIRQFYSWYRDEDKRLNSKEENKLIDVKRFYRYLEKEVSISYKLKQANPETIITEEDINKVLEDGCKTPKEKAFISTLHETGCRVSEFLNLKIQNIKFRDNLAEVYVPDGKTGERKIFVTKSIPYLIKYLDVHQNKKDNNSYLWLSDSNYNLGKPIMYVAGKKLIKRCFQKAKVNKRCNFHWFRHSRATILAPKLTEVMLCKYMGWSIGSRQIRVYTHLSAGQLEDVFLQIHGIKKKEDNESDIIKCICGSVNSSRERFCFKCYKPLSQGIAIQEQEVKELGYSAINETMNFFMEMAKNPELMNKFENFKREIRGNENE